MSEANKAILRRAAEQIWNAGKLDLVDEIVAPHAVGHKQGEGMHREDFKQTVKEMRAAFPDLHITVDHQVAEGDSVVTFTTMRGTHKGDFRGLRATGKAITVKGCSHSRIQNGQVIEENVLYDQLSMVTQLGIRPEQVDLSPHIAKS